MTQTKSFVRKYNTISRIASNPKIPTNEPPVYSIIRPLIPKL